MAMNNIILYFLEKYKQNWQSVYDAIVSKEKIDSEIILNYHFNKATKYISILDENYPSKFKNTHMPPYILCYEGNLSFINENVLGVFGKPTTCDLLEFENLSKFNFVFCFEAEHLNLEDYENLLSRGLKIILIASSDLNSLKKFKNHYNVLKVSEYYDDKFNKSLEQTTDRIFYSISDHIFIKSKHPNSIKIIFQNYQNKRKKCYLVLETKLEKWINDLIKEQLVMPIEKLSDIISTKS